VATKKKTSAKKKASAKKKTTAKKKAAPKKPAARKSRGAKARSSEEQAGVVYSDVRRQLRSQLLGRLR
jgi:hypothetical protein